MELELKNLYLLPLKELALRRVASCIWSRHASSFCTMKLNLLDLSKQKEESAITQMAKHLTRKLPLPAATQKELVEIMKPICREIMKWQNFHKTFLKLDDVYLLHSNNLQCICWTHLGTVDYRKTAKALILHGNLGTSNCYKLACLYCFDVLMRHFWRKTPQLTKMHFLKNVNPLRIDIVVLWTCIIEGQVNKLNSLIRRESKLNRFAFQLVAIAGHKSATQYFFERLSSQEMDIQALLLNTAEMVADEVSDDNSYLHEYQKHNDVLRYLLTQMNAEQLQTMLERYAFQTLKCFMDWPTQNTFIKIANLAFPYLTEDDYYKLLSILSNNIISNNNLRLFQYLFEMCPKDLRRHILSNGCFIEEFFRVGDAETVRFILRNLDNAERVELVIGNVGISICYMLVKDDKWYMLEVFIQEAKLSKEETKILAQRFASRTMEQRLCKRFIRLVNKINADSSKSDKVPVPSVDIFKRHPAKEFMEKPTKKQRRKKL